MKLRITVEGLSYDVEVEFLDTEAPVLTPQAPQAASQQAAQTSRSAPPAAAPAAAPARPAAQPSGAGSEDRVCKSPIAGTVLQVKVKPGDTVSLNQVIAIMEAMKMETNIASPVAGTVRAVHVSAGDAVKQGQLLVEFA